MDFALILIKPDAFKRNLETAIYDAIKRHGLSVVHRKIALLNEAEIREYQPVLNEPSQFGEEWKYEAIEALTSGPVEVILVEGDDAIQLTNALKKEVRSTYGLGKDYRNRVIFNLIHTADNLEEFKKNVKVLLPGIGTTQK